MGNGVKISFPNATLVAKIPPYFATSDVKVFNAGPSEFYHHTLEELGEEGRPKAMTTSI